jgi:RNA polymerase sigma-70 factor (ECF subfamily)
MAIGEVWGEDLVRQLYAEHGRSLLAYATRLTGDVPAAEDVVQETLVRAWKHADDLRGSGKGSVRGWLLTVARNLVIDRSRARAIRPREVAEVTEVADGTPAPPVERDHAQSVVDSMAVLAAMDGLSAEHREVVRQVYFHGSTVGEIAATMSVAPGTVKSRLHYALRALRAAMEPDSGLEVAG